VVLTNGSSLYPSLCLQMTPIRWHGVLGRTSPLGAVYGILRIKPSFVSMIGGVFFRPDMYSMLVEEVLYKNAYVINLRRREDRWRVTKAHLSGLGFAPTRFEAVDGASIPDPLVQVFTTPRARESIHRGYRREHHEISRGSVGCSLSHFALWRKLLDSEQPHMTVFEDDAECLRPDALGLLPFGSGRFDLLLLGGLYDYSSKDVTAGLSVKEVKRFLCTHAYVIWKDAAWRLLQFAFPIQKQVDFYMHMLPTITIMACVPSLFHQRPAISQTDVQIPLQSKLSRQMVKRLFAVIMGVWSICVALLIVYFRVSR